MNSQTVNIDEAKNQLSELITIASEGGEVIIMQDGKPLARLVPPADMAAYQSLTPTPDELSTDDDSPGVGSRRLGERRVKRGENWH